MKSNTNRVVAQAAPRIRNLFHLLGSARLTLAIKRDEQTEIRGTTSVEERPQSRNEIESERRFEFDRFRHRAQTRAAHLQASTRFHYDQNGTPRFATPEACLNGDASFEKAMTFQEWLALRRVTR